MKKALTTVKESFANLLTKNGECRRVRFKNHVQACILAYFIVWQVVSKKRKKEGKENEQNRRKKKNREFWFNSKQNKNWL